MTSAIERSRGSKDVLIEVDDSGSAHTGTYRVRRATGEAIAYEIVLRHE